ncbi:hypothetical protein Tco_0080015 [Tanacetum coccineum]
MQKNQLALIKPKWNATIATRQGILLESVESREIKIIGRGNDGNLEIRIGEPDWKEGRTLKAWCPLLERFIPHRAIKEYRNCTEDTSDAGDLKKRIIEYRSRLFVLPIWSFLLSTITPDLKT